MLSGVAVLDVLDLGQDDLGRPGWQCMVGGFDKTVQQACPGQLSQRRNQHDQQMDDGEQ